MNKIEDNIVEVADVDYKVPAGFTGIVINKPSGYKSFFLNGNLHNEKGPALIALETLSAGLVYKEWWLNKEYYGNIYWNFDFTDQIILSKIQQPNYPTVQVWKILGPNGLCERFIIPGMEEFIKE